MAGFGAAPPYDRPVTDASWQAYLADFHARKPGITEQVLRRARRDDGDAYEWLAAALPQINRILDLACGSSPLWPLPGHHYVGVDVSTAELAAAQTRGVPRLIQATAAALPLTDASIDAVTCSMSLQILTPLADVLGEISRVLRPGGLLVATVPSSGPLRPADLPSLAGLLAALGRGLDYPNGPALRQLPHHLTGAGLRLISDQRLRFPYRLRSAADADLFLASLYLPDLSERRRRAARRWLHALARLQITLPVPIRRIRAARA
jgi:SAM-dependent methyltransferase